MPLTLIRTAVVVSLFASLLPGAQDFGQLAVNTNSTTVQSLTVALSRSGSEALVGSLQFGIDFKIGVLSCVANSCTVPVTFSPRYPGSRQDAVKVKDSIGRVLGKTLLYGVGLGPQIGFVPGAISTLPRASDQPSSIATDAAGDVFFLYHSSATNDVALGEWLTYASQAFPVLTVGVGTGGGIAVDGSGDIYVADTAGHKVRKVDGLTRTISIVAGTGVGGNSGDGGPAVSAELTSPTGLALDSSGNLYIASFAYVRKVDAVTGIITTVAGNGSTGDPRRDGVPATSEEVNPTALAFDASNNLFIADANSRAIREVDAITQIISTVAGGGSTSGHGPATQALIDSPGSLAVDAAVICTSPDMRIYEAFRASGELRTIVSGLGIPAGIAFSPSDRLVFSFRNASGISVMQGGAPLNFGLQETGLDDVVLQTTIENIGNQPLLLYGAAISPDFTFIPFAGDCSLRIPLSPGAVCNFSTAFASRASGSVAGSLQLSDDSLNIVGAQQTVALEAQNGLIAVAPSALHFTGSIQGLGTAASPQTVRITNPFFQPYKLGQISITGQSASVFSETNACPVILAGGESCAVSLTFSPKQAGTALALLAVGGVTVSLTGVAADFYEGCQARLSTPVDPVLTASSAVSVSISAKANCPFQLRVGGPSGRLFAQTGSSAPQGAEIDTQTGAWVSNGTTFYMQQYGDITQAGTLATLRVGVKNCTVNTFYVQPFNENKTVSDTFIDIDASCAYDIRIGGSSGPLFASLSGRASVKTGVWVTTNMLFYLQAAGDTTPAGTLAFNIATTYTFKPGAMLLP